MTVPKTREVLLPLFKVLRENNVITFKSAANLVALRMNLTEEDKEAGTKNSNTFLTNVSFAGTKLKKQGIMEVSTRGIWQITEKGTKISIEEFCQLFNINDQNVKRKTGEEFFCIKDERLNFKLKDFWSWNQSDILNNVLRGVLAEYIVATAIEAKNEIRIEWDAYDLITKGGIKVEVKSASYLQSWKQIELSKISFDISPTKAWNSETNEYNSETKRQADVYVFCLLKNSDRVTIDPLKIDQWEFYIVSTEKLNNEKGAQKSIGLNPLLKLDPIVTDYKGIKKGVLDAVKNK
ncbi:MAG: hypothetical protein E7211_16980 [Clostridium lundense]|nr:hypothetical protein [Clostridium lundense]